MDFLVFSDDWGRHPTTCEHLFRALLPQHRVIWVNTIGTRTPRFRLYDLRRAVEKLKAYGSRPERVDEHPNLVVLSPPLLPFPWRWSRAYNRWAVRRAVTPALKALEFNDYAAVTSLPTTADFLRDFPGSMTVYYCVDDFVGMPGVDPARIRAQEKDLIEATRLHLYAAKTLADKFNSRAHYFPHGVDFEHFLGDDRAPLPRTPGRPVIGFFGHLGAWIDIPLLRELIDTRRDWTFLIVGGTDIDVSPLRGYDHVLWTGHVPYDRLPAYGRWFDVGLIPYRVDDPRMLTVNPTKLREYLALGLPVVSIPLPEIETLDAGVYTAEGARGFEQAVERALHEDTPALREARRRLAREQSWVRRGETLLRLIKERR